MFSACACNPFQALFLSGLVMALEFLFLYCSMTHEIHKIYQPSGTIRIRTYVTYQKLHFCVSVPLECQLCVRNSLQWKSGRQAVSACSLKLWYVPHCHWQYDSTALPFQEKCTAPSASNERENVTVLIISGPKQRVITNNFSLHSNLCSHSVDHQKWTESKFTQWP